MRVGFLSGFPLARWGPLFHVLCLERPGLQIAWLPLPFPRQDAPLLAGADVGLLLQPPVRPGLATLTLDVSPMVVVVAVGHPLAQREELRVADVVGARFPRHDAALDREWAAFWTLDAKRGGTPATADTEVDSMGEGLEAVASGAAIATTVGWGRGRAASSRRRDDRAERRAACRDLPRLAFG